jgi:hypothetical protein
LSYSSLVRGMLGDSRGRLSYSSLVRGMLGCCREQVALQQFGTWNVRGL